MKQVNMFELMSNNKNLDSFFGTKAPSPVERCENPACRKPLTPKVVKVELTRKGVRKVYCQACAKAILRPQEQAAEL